MKKFFFVAGLAIGYVLGARAGRASYEKLKSRATEIWEDPRVQKRVHEAEEFVQEKAPIVQAKLGEAAGAAAETVAGLAKTAKERISGGDDSGSGSAPGSGSNSTN